MRELESAAAFIVAEIVDAGSGNKSRFIFKVPLKAGWAPVETSPRQAPAAFGSR